MENTLGTVHTSKGYSNIGTKNRTAVYSLATRRFQQMGALYTTVRTQTGDDWKNSLETGDGFVYFTNITSTKIVNLLPCTEENVGRFFYFKLDNATAHENQVQLYPCEGDVITSTQEQSFPYIYLQEQQSMTAIVYVAPHVILIWQYTTFV